MLLLVFFVLFFFIPTSLESAKPKPSAPTKPAPKIPIPASKPRRLCMFFDYYDAEYKDNAVTDKDSMAARFAINLFQEASSCIIHKSILLNFLTRKKSNEQWYTTAKLDPAIWDIYAVSNTPLFIIMRKKDQFTDTVSYQLEGKATKTIDIPIFQQAQWVPCADAGNVSTLDEEKKSIEKIISFVNQSTTSNFSIKHLQTIFKTEKDFKENKELKTMIDEFKAAGKDVLENRVSLVKQFSRACNIFIAGHGNVDYAIAGVSAKDFTDILIFFNNLNTNFVIINTCSSGGKNVNYFKLKEQTQLNFSYYLAIAGISDAPTIMQKGTIGDTINIGKDSDIKKFFASLEKKLPSEEELKAAAKVRKKKKTLLLPSHLHKNIWLKNVLTHLTLIDNWFYSNYGINAIPQIWIPGTGWFSPIEIDPDIQTIHDVTTAQYAASEKKEIAIENKLALLIDPTIIHLPLKIIPKEVELEQIPGKFKKSLQDYFPVILDYLEKYNFYVDSSKKEITLSEKSSSQKQESYFFYPTFLPTHKDSDLYFFKKILIDIKQQSSSNIFLKKHSGVLHFIRDSFLNTQGREIKKLFFIKELTGYNDLSIVLDAVNFRAPDFSNPSLIKTTTFNTSFLEALKPFFQEDITLSDILITAWEKEISKTECKNVILYFTITESGKKSYWMYSAQELGNPDAHISDIAAKKIFPEASWKFQEVKDQKTYQEKLINACTNEGIKKLTEEEQIKQYIQQKLLAKGISKDYKSLYDTLYAEYKKFILDENKFSFDSSYQQLTPSDTPKVPLILNKNGIKNLFAKLEKNIDKRAAEDKDFDQKISEYFIKKSLGIKQDVMIDSVYDAYQNFCTNLKYSFNYTWPWDASLMEDNKDVTFEGKKDFKPVFTTLKSLNENKLDSEYKKLKYAYFLENNKLIKGIKAILIKKQEEVSEHFNISPNYVVKPLYEEFKKFIEQENKYIYPETITLQPSTEKITLEAFEIKDLFESIKSATPEQLKTPTDKAYEKLVKKIQSFLDGTIFEESVDKKSIKQVSEEKKKLEEKGFGLQQSLGFSLKQLELSLEALKKGVGALSKNLTAVSSKLTTLKGSLDKLSKEVKPAP